MELPFQVKEYVLRPTENVIHTDTKKAPKSELLLVKKGKSMKKHKLWEEFFISI